MNRIFIERLYDLKSKSSVAATQAQENLSAPRKDVENEQFAKYIDETLKKDAIDASRTILVLNELIDLYWKNHECSNNDY